MNYSLLKEALRPWMQVQTWHTTHPSDETRFHEALKVAFDRLGHRITGEDFENAMQDLANELYPKMDPDMKSSEISAFATRAEYIASYLNDTSSP